MSSSGWPILNGSLIAASSVGTKAKYKFELPVIRFLSVDIDTSTNYYVIGFMVFPV